MRKVRRYPAVLALLVVSVMFVAPATAQDIQYKDVTTVKFAGPLGRVLNFAARLGGAPDESVTTTSVKGAKLRSDQDKSSMIMDLEGARFINIDHERKTYTVMTAKQLVETMEAVQARAQQAQAQAKAQPNAQQQKPQVEADFKFDLKVDRTGEKQKVNGYDAERAFVTMKTDMSYTPEGETQKQEAGTLVVLNDMWNVKDLPIEQAMERMYKVAPDVARKSGAQDFAAVFAQNPKMGAALQKAAEESEKLEGTAVKSTTYMVLLPPGLEFDRALALGTSKSSEKNESGLKAAAGGALRGMLGGKKQEEQKKEEEAKPQQMTLITVVSEIRDIQLKSLPASLFEPPAGYKEVPYTVPAR